MYCKDILKEKKCSTKKFFVFSTSLFSVLLKSAHHFEELTKSLVLPFDENKLKGIVQWDWGERKKNIIMIVQGIAGLALQYLPPLQRSQVGSIAVSYSILFKQHFHIKIYRTEDCGIIGYMTEPIPSMIPEIIFILYIAL